VRPSVSSQSFITDNKRCSGAGTRGMPSPHFFQGGDASPTILLKSLQKEGGCKSTIVLTSVCYDSYAKSFSASA